MADGAPPCELLNWDSEHFGFRIATVTRSTLDEFIAGAVDEWCARNEVRCLYLLTDPADAETSRVAAEHRFRTVDTRLIVRRSLEEAAPSAGPPGLDVAEAAESERGYLRSLAGSSYRGTSRFYVDGGFPPERCDAMYSAWIDRGLSDPERTILVARLNGEPAGYQVVGPLESDGARRLELLAVDPSRRGLGVGAGLISAALQRLRAGGSPRTWTVLSARNTASFRLHEQAGFLTADIGVWHHKWYGGE